MKSCHHSKLIIQNQIENLAEAEACLTIVAEQIGFNEHDNKQIQLALEEALTNIIKHSFAPGQLEDIDIEFCQVPLGLKVSIWVRGIPFDPALFPIFNRKDLEENLNDRGLGHYLIQQVMDEYFYINHGKEGIEVILAKNLPSRSIEELINEGKAGEAPTSKAATKQVFDIGLMVPDEAVEVSRLAYYAYGYSYPYENIYFPEKLVRLNRSGNLVSMVARLQSGEIIGHAALEKGTDLFANAELGIAFSNPSFRGMGIMSQLWEALIEKAIEEDIFGIYAMSVTTHPYSQKASHHYGLKDCALLLSKVPVLKFRDIQEGSHPRESIMIAYRYLNLPESTTVFAPERHSRMIRRIFSNIGFEPIITDERLTLDDLKGRRTKLKVKPNHEFVTATIQVDQYGEHAVKKVSEDLKHFCVERFETIYLTLNLHDPFTAILCPEFEKLGFFFAGIHPANDEISFLVMQYLNNQVMDYNSLDLDSDFGKELAEYVKACDPN